MCRVHIDNQKKGLFEIAKEIFCVKIGFAKLFWCIQLRHPFGKSNLIVKKIQSFESSFEDPAIYQIKHGLRTPNEEMAFTAQPKIKAHSQMFRYGWSIFCLPRRPKLSDFFDLCLHWVSVVRASYQITTLKNAKTFLKIVLKRLDQIMY